MARRCSARSRCAPSNSRSLNWRTVTALKAGDVMLDFLKIRTYVLVPVLPEDPPVEEKMGQLTRARRQFPASHVSRVAAAAAPEGSSGTAPQAHAPRRSARR